LLKLRDEGETGDCVVGDAPVPRPVMMPVTGGDAEPGYMLASWAWVKERPDCDRKELVLPTDDGFDPGREGRWWVTGLGCCTPGGVERSRDVEGDDDKANG
jgi:hypothetical protein